MNIAYKGTNLTVTTAIEKYVEKKMRAIGTSLKGAEIRIDVELEKTTEHHTHGRIFRAEFMVKIPTASFRAEATREDLYTAIDSACAILRDEIRGSKGKRATAFRRGARTIKGWIQREQ